MSKKAPYQKQKKFNRKLKNALTQNLKRYRIKKHYQTP